MGNKKEKTPKSKGGDEKPKAKGEKPEKVSQRGAVPAVQVPKAIPEDEAPKKKNLVVPQKAALSKDILERAKTLSSANKKAKKTNKAKQSSDESSESSSSSSEDEKSKATQLNKKAGKESSEESSDSESSEEKPKPAKLKTAPSRPAPVSESSSEDDDVPPPKAAAKAKPAKVVPPAKDDDSSESDSESDSDDDDHAVKSAKPSPAKVAPVAKQVASEESDSDESTDESDNDTPPSKTINITKQAAPKKTAANESDDSSDDDSDDDSDQEENAKPAKRGAPSSESDSEDEDGDVTMADGVSAANGSNKRKATDHAQPQAKKVKLDDSAGDAPEESKTIFVGRLSWSVDNDRLAQEFAHCGEVESANVQMDRDSGKSRGFGYVRFTTTEAVEKALLMNGQEIDGRAVNIDRSTAPDKSQVREKRAKAFGDQTSPPSSTLFVGNLSFDVTEDTVWSFFNDYGVKHVRLPTDRDTGRPKGFGYVEFDDVDGAKKAFEAANGAEIEGRSIRLDYSQPRDSSGGGRGGGFGDRGGRGGGRGFGDRGGRGGGRGFGDRGRGGGRGGRGGFDRGGRGGDRGGRGRGGPRGMSKNGGIAAFEGKKITF